MEEKEIIKGKKILINKNFIVTTIIITILSWGLAFVFQMNKMYDLLFVLYIGILGIIILLPVFYVYFYTKNMDLTVSNKRVYGVAGFGRRIDLPLDSISSVGTSFLNSIFIGTSSGRIFFMLMKNNKEIHIEISKLLNSRQNNEQCQVNNNDVTEELKKYKELLDDGVITQEEFNEKKKQLLNL